jgi:hypothetical protein
MVFLIFGPLEAHNGGRKLALGGAKQRALLAIALPRPAGRGDRTPAGRRAHFEDALAMAERIGARPALARAELDYATLVLNAMSPAMPRERAGCWRAAWRRRAQSGMPVLAERVSALREQAAHAG